VSKAELKRAMGALQVGQPLRLSTRAPSFTAPEVPQDRNPTQVEKLDQVEIQTQVGKQSQAMNPTQVETPTAVSNTTPVESPTPVGNPTQVMSSGRRATEQDSSVILEAQASEKLSRGYTRVPNAILMRLVGSEFTRNEIKLVLVIARFTISYQRRLAPLSKAVLERLTGLRGPAILEALSGLVAKGIVEKEQGDQHKPNLLGLILPDDWDNPGKGSRPPGESGQSENLTQGGNCTPAQNPTQVVSQSPAGVEKPTGAGVGNPTYFKDKERYLNINSLSAISENLREYFSELKPARKKESEWRVFLELKADYPVADIGDCFERVREKGIHSPMAYLAKAMSEVLGEVRALREKHRAAVAQEKALADQLQREREALEAEAREWECRERAFRRTFADEKRETDAIAELCRGMPFRAQTQAGRTFAIGRWWEGLSEVQRRDQAG
jgi:phage replication O-like protein O